MSHKAFKQEGLQAFIASIIKLHIISWWLNYMNGFLFPFIFVWQHDFIQVILVLAPCRKIHDHSYIPISIDPIIRRGEMSGDQILAHIKASSFQPPMMPSTYQSNEDFLSLYSGI
jgi:hypothetical protein